MTLTGGMTRPIEVPSERTRHRASVSPGRRVQWWAAPVLVGAVAGGWLSWLTHGAISDDGYITLSIARNLADAGCWCVTAGVPSNTGTSALFVIVLAAVMLVTSPVAALAVVTTAAVAATSLATAAAARSLGWSASAGPVAAVVLVANPVTQAAIGLETALAVALVAGLLLAVLRARPVWVGVACGLLVLTRPDLAVFAVVAGAVDWRRLPTVAGAAVAIAAPWWAVSTLVFGAPIPDTLAWKQAQTQGLGGRLLGDALPLFADKWPAATALAVGLLAAGGIALCAALVLRPTHPVALVVGLGGAAHLALMVALGVPPFVWYLGPAIGTSALLVGCAVAWRPRSLAWAAVVGLVGLGIVYADRHDYPGQGNPFHANGALVAQYAAIAAAVPTGEVVATEHGEIGTVAFFCADRCTAVDPLADPGRLAPVIERRLEQSAVMRAVYAAWSPSSPIPAQWRTASGAVEGGQQFSTWSGYTGGGYITLLPAG